MRFWSAFAERYDAWYSGETVAREDARIDAALRPLFRRAASVVDVGCGTGALLDRHAPLDGTYLGLDVSDQMLDRLRGKYGGAEIVQADMDRRFNLARRFDLAVCEFSFNYFERPDIALENLSRLVRPGGVLFLALLEPKRQLYASCPHRFGRRCPTLFHTGRTFEGRGFRVRVDEPFGVTGGYRWPRIEDRVARAVPALANYRIVICDRT